MLNINMLVLWSLFNAYYALLNKYFYQVQVHNKIQQVLTEQLPARLLHLITSQQTTFLKLCWFNYEEHTSLIVEVIFYFNI